MSRVKSAEMNEENLAMHQANGRQSPGLITPESKTPAEAAHMGYGPYANTLMKVRRGGLTPNDVKNADRSGDMYENKGLHDKMADALSDIYGNSSWILQKSSGFDGQFSLLDTFNPDFSPVGWKGGALRGCGKTRRDRPLFIPAGDTSSSRGQRPRKRRPATTSDPERVEFRMTVRRPYVPRVRGCATPSGSRNGGYAFRGRCPRLLTCALSGYKNTKGFFRSLFSPAVARPS